MARRLVSITLFQNTWHKLFANQCNYIDSTSLSGKISGNAANNNNNNL